MSTETGPNNFDRERLIGTIMRQQSIIERQQSIIERQQSIIERMEKRMLQLEALVVLGTSQDPPGQTYKHNQ